MFKEIIKEIDWCGHTLRLSTGRMGRYTDGAVTVQMGETIVLCTVVSDMTVGSDATFFPLTVHYREMKYAAGKIPGGYVKRESKPSDDEVLISRLIDRPLRPLFHPDFLNNTQVICTVLSYDDRYSPDILAMIGTAAAIRVAKLPVLGTLGTARVGYIDGNFVLNPSRLELANSYLDLVVAGTNTSIMMVESEANELPESVMLEAICFGHDAMQVVIEAIDDFAKSSTRPDRETPNLGLTPMIDEICEMYGQKILDIYYPNGIGVINVVHDNGSPNDSYVLWATQDACLKVIRTALREKYSDVSSIIVDTAFEYAKAKVVRAVIMQHGVRIDHRTNRQVRKIAVDVGILPRAHGSALFTRGETQSLSTTTLGSTADEQVSDKLYGEERERFMLHYNFPPYAVNATSVLKAPGRREIGHGKLAWRALNPVLPSKSDFPYAMRVVSEITSCNGSSSMATVCGATLSLLDAGVPLRNPVAGIAMGLIKEGDSFVVLSDIVADEDYLGDMDFKVAGSIVGITALQMDIKIAGITRQIIASALEQAYEGRLHILSKMTDVIAEARDAVSVHAPRVVTMRIDKEKIRDLIGPGGKMIREICEKTGAKIDISDEGIVQISVVGTDNMDRALGMVKAVTFVPEVGSVIEGKVIKVLDSGAFVNIAPGLDGFLHISEIMHGRVENIRNHICEGDVISTKIIDFDRGGKVKLSLRALLEAPAGAPAPFFDATGDGNSEQLDGNTGGGRNNFGNGQPRGERRGGPSSGNFGGGGQRGERRGGPSRNSSYDSSANRQERRNNNTERQEEVLSNGEVKHKKYFS